MGEKVRAVLPLTRGCPECILDADFLDVRFIGVPLEPGILPTDRCFDCFGITLLLCRGMPVSESVTLLGASSSGSKEGCCHILILRGQWDDSACFEAVPRKVAIGMYDLVNASKANTQYLDAILQAATKHEQYLRNWAQQNKKNENLQDGGHDTLPHGTPAFRAFAVRYPRCGRSLNAPGPIWLG